MATKKPEKFFVVRYGGWSGLEVDTFDSTEDAEEFIADLIHEGAIEDVEEDIAVYRGVSFEVIRTTNISLKEVK